MKAKFIPEDGAFNLAGWTLSRLEDADDLLRGALEELLELATKESISTYFAGKGDDPLDIIVAIPIAGAELEEPTWIFNLRELVRHEVEGWAHQVPGAGIGGIGGGYIDDEGRPEVEKLRDALRTLVDLVDDALKRPPPSEDK